MEEEQVKRLIECISSKDIWKFLYGKEMNIEYIALRTKGIYYDPLYVPELQALISIGESVLRIGWYKRVNDYHSVYVEEFNSCYIAIVEEQDIVELVDQLEIIFKQENFIEAVKREF